MFFLSSGCFFFHENWRGPISLRAGVLCRNAEEEQQHEGAPDLVILYLERRRLEDVERRLTAVTKYLKKLSVRTCL